MTVVLVWVCFFFFAREGRRAGNVIAVILAVCSSDLFVFFFFFCLSCSFVRSCLYSCLGERGGGGNSQDGKGAVGGKGVNFGGRRTIKKKKLTKTWSHTLPQTYSPLHGNLSLNTLVEWLVTYRQHVTSN